MLQASDGICRLKKISIYRRQFLVGIPEVFLRREIENRHRITSSTRSLPAPSALAHPAFPAAMTLAASWVPNLNSQGV